MTAQGQASYPWYGWAGWLIMATSQAGLLLGNRFAAVWLTPLMWTGYILAVDGLVARQGGGAWLRDRLREFPLLCLLSVGVWLVFEVYNLHLMSWRYAGLPASMLERDVGYFWSFATIMPGVFVTADLIQAGFLKRARRPAKQAGGLVVGPAWAWFLAGVAMCAIPLALPRPAATYSIPAAWLGYIFLLDPLNERLGLHSFRRDWRQGRYQRTQALLAAGLACGLLWETWNYQASLAGGGHWIYTFPDAYRLTGLYFGRMPLFGLLGFLPFALELSAFYELLKDLLGGRRVFALSRGAAEGMNTDLRGSAGEGR